MTAEPEFTNTVRGALANAGDVREVRMFGGIGFMLGGNLVAAISRRGLLLRVGRDQQAQALARPGARPMVMRGRTMDGYVYIDPPALNAREVQAGLRTAIAYVRTLPAKRTPSRARTTGK